MNASDMSGATAADQNAWKQVVAVAAARTVPDGATVGLGTGSTAELFVRALAERVQAGLRVRAVTTSERTRALAERVGITLVDLDAVATLEMSFDGADEVTLPGLDLIKGRGGALLREKLVASVSQFRVILVDATKVTPALGTGTAIPVEVDPYGWSHTAARLGALGAHVGRRAAAAVGADSGAPAPQPLITDGGHYTLDLIFGAVPDVATLAARIKATVGVIEHGLFLGMTERLYIGGPDGVRVVDHVR